MPDMTFKIRLSDREKEVLHYIALGFNSKQIGEKLFVSKNTVDSHRRNMIKKQAVKSTQELVDKLFC